MQSRFRSPPWCVNRKQRFLKVRRSFSGVIEEGWRASMVSTDGLIHRSAPGSIPGAPPETELEPLRSRFRRGTFGSVSVRQHIETHEAP